MKLGYASILLQIAISATPLWSAEMPQAGSNLGNVKGGDFKAAHSIIEQKCTRCHSGQLIDAALSANKDMPRLQQQMEKKGAKLNRNERGVLGIYWEQNPLKQKK